MLAFDCLTTCPWLDFPCQPAGKICSGPAANQGHFNLRLRRIHALRSQSSFNHLNQILQNREMKSRTSKFYGIAQTVEEILNSSRIKRTFCLVSSGNCSTICDDNPGKKDRMHCDKTLKIPDSRSDKFLIVDLAFDFSGPFSEPLTKNLNSS